MDMGMVEQILPPGVKDGEEADLGSQVLGIAGDDAQRLGGGTEEDAVEDPFVEKGDGGDLFGHREDHMKIGGIEQLGLAILDPLRTSQGLTLTAVTVSTGVIPDALVAALVTLFHMPSESGSPACLDRVHDATLGTGQRGMAIFTVGFTVAAEDIRHFQPSMFHQITA